MGDGWCEMGAREPVDEDVVDGLVEGEVESELVSLCVARQVHLLLRLHHLRPNRNLTTMSKRRVRRRKNVRS